MYMLKQIALVHWHGFTICTHHIKGMTGILGENRAGKSTLIDAISLVLGGASMQYVELNAAASDEKSKERSIGGYILGQTSKKTLMRDAATSYVALTFEHLIDPAKPSVTMGFRASASRDNVLSAKGGDRTDTKELFLFQGPVLVAEDYCQFTGTRGDALTLHQLKDRVTDQGGTFEDFVGNNQTLTYIRACWRHLSTLKIIGEDHARQWVKSMRRALAFKTSDNPGDFISEFLLERNDIETKELNECIQTYRKLHKDVAAVKKRAQALAPIVEKMSKLKDIQDRLGLHTDALPLINFWIAKSSCGWQRQRLTLLTEEAETTALELESLREQQANIQADYDELVTIRASQSEAAQVEKLEARQKSLAAEQKDIYAQLQDVYQALENARDAWRYSDLLSDSPEVYRSLKGLADFHSKHPGSSWMKDPETVSARLKSLLPHFEKVKSNILLKSGSAQARLEGLLKRKADLIKRLVDLDKGILRPPEHVEHFVNDLNTRGVKATLVRDAVEIAIPSWQPSIEAVLGSDREAIIVEPQDYERALEVLRSKIARYSDASLVNTAKLDQKPPRPPLTGSLFEAVVADNRYVEAFLTLRLGQIKRTGNSHELKVSNKGVLQTETPEGINVTFNDGAVTRNRRVPRFVLGQGALASQLSAIETERQEVDREIANLKEEVSDLSGLAKAISSMERGLLMCSKIDILIDDYNRVERNRLEAEDLVKRLIAKENPELVEKFEKLDREKALARQNEHECMERASNVTSAIKTVKNILGSNEIGSTLYLANMESIMKKKLGGGERRLSNWRRALLLYAEKRSLKPGDLLPKCTSWEDKVAPNHYHRMKVVDMLSKAREDLRISYSEVEAGLRIAISDYYRHFNILDDRPEEMDRFFGKGGVAQHVEAEYQFLTGTRLEKAERALRDAAQQIETILQGTFLTELGSRLNDARTKVDRLTAALRNRPLHNERYQFVTRYAPGRHEDLARLADKVCSDDEMGEPIHLPLFSAQLDEDHPDRNALLQLREILEDPKEDFDTYKDYTNYLKFDLVYENLETGELIAFKDRKGSGSGAEKGTPWYVAIGAALASLYHGHNDRTGPGIGFGPIVFDEAFAKLDAANQATLMDFFDGLGLQVILGTPDDRRLTSMSYLNTILDVTRIGNKSSIFVTDIHDYLREMLRNINPAMLSEDMLRHVCMSVDISGVDMMDKDALIGALLAVREAAQREREERLAIEASEGDDSFYEEAV